jgi:hypothetical protein
MTHMTLAGQIIADAILGKENPYRQIYTPERKLLGKITISDSFFVVHFVLIHVFFSFFYCVQASRTFSNT